MQKPCFSSFYSSSWWPSPSSPPTQPERQGNCLTITGMLMKTPTISQWNFDTTFQMCHLQMGLFRSGPGHKVHFTMKTTMSHWPPWPAGTYGASCPSMRMRKRSASTLPSGSSEIPLPWKDTRVYHSRLSRVQTSLGNCMRWCRMSLVCRS